MAVAGAAEVVGSYGGEFRSQPPDPGRVEAELREKLGSMELAVNPPAEREDLVQVLEAAESAIREQMQENVHLKSTLRATELELHNFKLDQSRQSGPQGYQPPHQSSQRLHAGGRSGGRIEGQGSAHPIEYQNGSLSLPGDVPVAGRQLSNGSNGSNGIASRGTIHNGQPIVDSGSFSRLSNESSCSVSPRGRRRERETDMRPQSIQGQSFLSDMPETNNHITYRPQDMMVRVPDDDVVRMRERLLDASIKEAQMLSDKRILERRVAELRLAYDQQQQGLVDAASKALSYRQDILEENIRLTYAVQVAEQERAVYVQSLMPLLAEFDLQPPVTDAHSMVSHIKILVQKLRSELELFENKVKESQYYRPPWNAEPPYQPPTSYTPPPQSPPFTGHGLEIVPSYVGRPPSPSPLQHAGPSWESGVSSPYAPASDDNPQQAAYNAPALTGSQRTASRAIVPHETMDSRGLQQPSDVFSDVEGDEPNGIHGHETDSDFDRPEAAPRSPQLDPLPEEPNSPGFEDGDPLPGIDGLRIVGDAVLGGRLTACGHPLNGTALCIFQWVRHYQNGSVAYIEGAAQPQYTITADDIDSMVAIECVPMDERGRRGDHVTVMANDGNWITRDSMMQDQIESYSTAGHASFEVQLLMEGASDESMEPAILTLRRSNYELRKNTTRRVVISEKYASDTSIKIPVGHFIQCLITSHDGRQYYLEFRDSRTRDVAVLTVRLFQKAAIEEQKRKGRRKWLRGRE